MLVKKLNLEVRQEQRQECWVETWWEKMGDLVALR